MKGIIVIELNLADNHSRAMEQIQLAVHNIRGSRSPQTTKDILIAVDDDAVKVLNLLKGPESGAE